ncbi:MAG TPA: hypothetical protein PLY58_04115 [Bacilli bacterium]|jgi:hypothetical protein|nr:hypothetical protein [Bacilli bacterium]HQA56235.1 hypothetical protein [Bacilli bacterium]
MVKETKYMTIIVESYPHGFEVKHYYLPVRSNFHIGDVIQSKEGKRYRVIDGTTQINKNDIDFEKFEPFE